MALFSQDYRHITFETPLGKDVLLITNLSGTEGMSQLFRFELSLVSENQGIVFKDIIGKSATIALALPTGNKRYINGVIARFAQDTAGGTTTGDTRVSGYRATLVPWFWLLTRSAESRIFQNMSVPEIVEKVFTDHGFDSFQLKLQGSHAKREYCVQYRETHFNFVSRLMEEEGIFYYFEHSSGQHKLIMADAPQTILPCPEQSSASYQVEPSDKEDFITAIEKMQEIRPSKYVLNDFNFETPNVSLLAEVPARDKLWQRDLEIYDYPGEYQNRGEGSSLTQTRMEEEEAQLSRIIGESGCRAFVSGYQFTLNNAFRKDMNGKKYLLTGLEINITHEPRSGGTFTYNNRFTCIPAEVPFRPLRTTPRPTVQGVQTAIVVGPSGEEIYPDEHGRVKVQFHWDREGKKNENSSCWIRVSQLWAGLNWGAMFIPRIGQEVIVDFLEGDPDRPIITGRVYNGINKPPYSLPADKTRSTIKSNSTTGGGGFNELRFEDKKENEEIFLHGQKNWTIQILNDKNQTVGHDETLDVGHDRTKNVKNDQSETVGENKSITVGKNHTESIGENASVTIGKNFTEDIAENSDTTVGKDMSIQVGKDSMTQVGENMSIDVGKKLNISAADQITLTTGSASIVMRKDGTITIKGKDITLNGSGKINVKASSDVILKGSKVLSN